uniref:Uncharacterized protein n=1 Tax=Arundo donax TaxID=35708 RepID=A0A0A8ZDJ8_ARUDO
MLFPLSASAQPHQFHSTRFFSLSHPAFRFKNII